MRLPWSKPKSDQLELLDADPELPHESSVLRARRHARSVAPPRSSKTPAEGDVSTAGRPLLVPLDRLSEDPNNRRTEFPEAEIDELADSIRQHGRVWSSDITYIATSDGWLYLAAVIDLFSRQVVGWSMQPHMQASLVTDALRMAWFRRQPAPGLVFHSDRGSQYCGNEFQDALKGYGMKSSMSRKGNCWDNAPTESLWGRLKVGRLYGKTFATQRDAMDEIIDWLTFYNHRRLHSTLDYVSPMRFEKNWHTAQQDKAA